MEGEKKPYLKRAATAQLIVSEIGVYSYLQSNFSAENVLLGDFNEEPNEMNVQSLKASWVE